MNDKVAIPVWAIASFLMIMNTTMFNVSLPSILQELGITPALGSWIVSGYSIVFALASVTFGRLSDFVPIRRLLTIGLVLLGVSSLIGYAAHSFGLLLTARLLQACGAGSVPALGVVLASRFVPFERRGRALTMIASGTALGYGVGPILGGAITEFFGWNGLFLVTCLVLPLMPVLRRLLPKETRGKFRFDAVGALITAVCAGSMLIAVSQLSLLFLLVALASAALTIYHLKKAKEPFIQLSLLRHGGYRKIVFLGFSILVVNLSILFLIPLILANAFHMEAASIGMMIFPGSIVSVISTRWIGRWIDQYGNYRFLLIGYSMVAASIIAISLSFYTSPYLILTAYVFYSPAFAMIMSSLQNEVSRIISKEKIGAGTGLLQLIQFFGGSLGVAVCGILIQLQNNQPIIDALRHISMALFVMPVCSLLVVIWYLKSNVGTPKKSLAADLSA